jgi:iron complex transport system ATP-binding protein
VLASGEPEQALSPGTVRAAFGLHSAIAPHPLTGRPHLTCALPE